MTNVRYLSRHVQQRKQVYIYKLSEASTNVHIQVDENSRKDLRCFVMSNISKETAKEKERKICMYRLHFRFYLFCSMCTERTSEQAFLVGEKKNEVKNFIKNIHTNLI